MIHKEIGSKDSFDVKNPEEKGYREIHYKNEMNFEKASEFLKSLIAPPDDYFSSGKDRSFDETSSNEILQFEGVSQSDARSESESLSPSDIIGMKEPEWGGKYTSYKERFDQTPSEDSERGSYEGERGESKFIPSRLTPEGKVAGEKLKQYGMDGVEYKNGEPDFSKCSECTVKIDNMSEHRDSNFLQADNKCAEKWNQEKRDSKADWTPRDVQNYRKENNLSWHERCDTHTMDLVPREIHSFFTHSGGCAECRVRDSKNAEGGEFDE